MTQTTREDMVVIRMGIDTLLECVRQTEIWWRCCGDGVAVRRAQQLANAIVTTRRKFEAMWFSDDLIANDVAQRI